MGGYTDIDFRHAQLFLKRFAGRTDAYGVKWYGKVDPVTGDRKMGYTPSCANHWADFCHLKIKDGIMCADCKNKSYVHINAETILKHIKGEEEQMIYVLREGSTIRFGAIDIDYKKGKEEKGYTWEDVHEIHELLDQWKIPHGLARSTGMGFHIYFFFNEECKAYIFRSFIKGLYVRLKINKQNAQGKRDLPEIFPKQDHYSASGLGNGIKPPMVEMNFSKGRNCFVDTSNVPVADQWKYLEEIPNTSEAYILEVMKENGIKITGTDQPPTNRTGSGAGAGSGSVDRGKWEQPLRGHIEKTLEACEAFRRIRDKCLKGEQPSHQEGFALYHLAMSTVDGVDWFQRNVPGWANSDQDLKQLGYSMNHNYAPHSCATMQNNSLCEMGKKCLEKKPPMNDKEAPVDKWPEPSPVRYAYGLGDDFLQKLEEEISSLNKKMEEGALITAIGAIVSRSLIFDPPQVKKFKEFIKKKKLIKAMHLNRMFSVAEKKQSEELKKKAESREDVFVVDGLRYMGVKPHGIGLLKIKKDGVEEVQLCSFDIILEKEVTIFGDDEDNEEPTKVYFGRFKCLGFEKEFRIEMMTWADNTKFYEFFSGLAGHVFNLLKANVDYLRHATLGLASINKIERNNCLMNQGWHGNTFVMPSVIIDEDGVRLNDTHPIDTKARKGFSSHLDFSYLNDDEAKDLLYHIKDEFLNAWPRLWTMVGLSHAIYPIIRRKLNMVEKPTLFFEGDSGCGKTQLTRALQHLWGSFPSLIGLLSTEKGIMSLCHEFKDALLVVDDYKAVNVQQRQTVTKIIQYSYNPIGTVKLRRDSSMATTKSPKGVLIISGEQFIANEISLLGRTIMIETRTFNTKKTEKQYQAVSKRMEEYKGLLPRFLSWFMGKDEQVCRDRLKKLKEDMYAPFAGGPNSDRIAVNLSVNYLCWELFVEFLEFSSVIDHDEKIELMEEHRDQIDSLMGRMVALGGEAHHGTVFKNNLIEAIQSAQVSIKGLQGYEHENKPPIGFKKPGVDNHIYLFPSSAFQAVQRLFDKEPLNITMRALARQLEDMGFFLQTDGKRHTCTVRHGKNTSRCWVVNMDQLGIEVEQSIGAKTVNAPKEAPPSPQKSGNIIQFPNPDDIV